MKSEIYIKLTLFLTLSFFILCSCENSKNQVPKTSQMILEVTSDYQGLWNISGERLEFRLFDNGVVEFDAFPAKHQLGTKAEEASVTKQTQISDEDLKDFIKLLSSEEFINLNYTLKCCCTDASINVEIISYLPNQRKRLFLKGFCDDNFINPDFRYAPNYPDFISELMRKIQRLKSKLSKG